MLRLFGRLTKAKHKLTAKHKASLTAATYTAMQTAGSTYPDAPTIQNDRDLNRAVG